uniref:Uncharacterized protein n=1 Tax=Cucumis melo TaxID=3656 RepID=A0A9I9EHG0_CUCME
MDATRSVVSTNEVRAAQHRWPNKPSISGVSLVVVLARDFQEEKKFWTKEEVENYKASLMNELHCSFGYQSCYWLPLAFYLKVSG